MNVLIFNVALAFTAAFACSRGGLPERWGGAALVVAALLTRLAYSPWNRRFSALEMGVFVVDLALLIVLVVLALRANRLWPLPLAGVQLAGVLVHLARVVDPGMASWVYAFLLKVWAYAALLFLTVGTVRHQRRLERFGTDLNWSDWATRTESE